MCFYVYVFLCDYVCVIFPYSVKSLSFTTSYVHTSCKLNRSMLKKIVEISFNIK